MQKIHAIVVPGSAYQTLYYCTQEALIKNVLGKIIATLTEYIVGIDADVETVLIKLYKTSEGSWYEPMDELNKATATEKLAIKSAIDREESALRK